MHSLKNQPLPSFLSKDWGDRPFEGTNQSLINSNIKSLEDNKAVRESNYRPDFTFGDFVFASDFEGGNLDLVVGVGEREFDCFMRVDTNTKGHLQWYYFQIKNKKRTKIKINICNFTKPHSMYNKVKK